MMFGTNKLEWYGYPMVKDFEYMFIPLDRIHERARQTDKHTPHDGIGRAYPEHRAATTVPCLLLPLRGNQSITV